MRLDITTTKGIPGATGTIASRENRVLYRGYYADVETALYRGVARVLQIGGGLSDVSVDGTVLETHNVVDRLEAYHGGVVGGLEGSDDVDFKVTNKLVAFVGEGETYSIF